MIESAIEAPGYTAIAPTDELVPPGRGWQRDHLHYQKPPVLTGYVVKYLEVGTNNPVAPEKTVADKEVGATVYESAIEVPGYTAIAPTDAELVLAEDGNEIIFYYQKPPVLTDYVIYLEKAIARSLRLRRP